ncbi:MAG: acyl-CoA dehydrogenase [Jatrophihabitans sp.]
MNAVASPGTGQRLLPDDASWITEIAAAAAGNADLAIEAARVVGERLPLPGGGHTAMRWHLLAEAAAADLTVGRVLEAHADALAILAEAGVTPVPGAWGVFAAEAPGSRLDAVEVGGAYRVNGVKPWCSLGGQLDRALVTAHEGDTRRLFAVDLHHASVRPSPAEGWVSRGLSAVPSGPVEFDASPASPVGDPGWYLRRAGFARGGIGVAACWFGGAAELHRTLMQRGRSGDLTDLHLGAIDVALHGAAATLRDAARTVDAGEDSWLLALRARSVVAAAAELTLLHVGHALGPAPLSFDEEYARRVADLQIYVRQHHGERDLAATGREVRGQ